MSQQEEFVNPYVNTLQDVPEDFLLQKTIRNRDYGNVFISNLLFLLLGWISGLLIWMVIIVAGLDVLFFLMKDFMVLNIYDQGIFLFDPEDQTKGLLIRNDELVVFHVTSEDVPSFSVQYEKGSGKRTISQPVHNFQAIYNAMDEKYPDKNLSVINSERIRMNFEKATGEGLFSRLIGNLKKVFKR